MSDLLSEMYQAHITERFLSHVRDTAEYYQRVAQENLRPSVLMRPNVFPDGSEWCALYGENLQLGVCAFGKTPELACVAFDIAWLNEPASISANSAATKQEHDEISKRAERIIAAVIRSYPSQSDETNRVDALKELRSVNWSVIK